MPFCVIWIIFDDLQLYLINLAESKKNNPSNNERFRIYLLLNHYRIEGGFSINLGTWGEMGIGTRHFTRVISPVIASHDQDIPLHCVKDNTAKTTATIPKWSLDIVNPNKCSRACSDFLKLGCFRFPIRRYFHNRMYPENNVGIEMSNPILIHYRHRAVFI